MRRRRSSRARFEATLLGVVASLGMVTLISVACDREPSVGAGADGTGSGSGTGSGTANSASSGTASVPTTPLAASADRAPTAPSQNATLPGLVSRSDELKKLAAPAPDPLSEADLAELVDLVETAFSDEVDTDLAGRAERRLERDERAPRILEYCLNDKSPSVRARCAFALGARGEMTAVPALLLRLRDEQIRMVQMWLGAAILTLHSHCPAALAAVQKRFDESDLVEAAGGIANDVLREAGIPLAEGASWDDARAGFRKLATHWYENGYALGAEPPRHATIDDIEPALRAILAARYAQLVEFDLRPVDLARDVMKNLGSIPLPLLRLGLTASENYLRAHTVEIVRDIGPAAAPLGDVVLPLLDDPVTHLAATQAVGTLRLSAAIPRLRALVTGPDLDSAAAAATALGEMRDEGSRELLRAQLASTSVHLDLKVYAAFGLARLDRALPDGGEGVAFLRDLKARTAYFEPTLDELIMSFARD